MCYFYSVQTFSYFIPSGIQNYHIKQSQFEELIKIFKIFKITYITCKETLKLLNKGNPNQPKLLIAPKFSNSILSVLFYFP